MINPNISLQIQPLRIKSPQQHEAEQLELESQRQAQKVRQMQMQQAEQEAAQKQRTLAGQDTLSKLLHQHSQQTEGGGLQTNHGAIVRDLAGAGYGDMALKYEQAWRSEQKSAIEDAKAQLDQLKEKNKLMSQALGAVVYAPEEERPQRYAVARQWAVQNGIIGPQDAPEAYDPAFVDQAWRVSQDVDKQVEQHRRDIEFDQKVLEWEQGVKEKAPKTAAEWQGLAAQMLAAAQDAEQWETSLASLKAMGAPEAALAPFGAAFGSGSAARAGELGMTPAQKAQQEQAKATAASAEAGRAETARHNRAMEGLQARGQVMADARQRENAQRRQNEKPASAAEQRAFGFYARAQDAEQVLNQMEPLIAQKGLAQQAWMKFMPNPAQSDENQVYTQAQRQFTEARLRKDSGAAIAESEYENDAKIYFPQPGDSKAVLDRKAKARATVLRALKTEAGRAIPEEERGGAAPAAPAAGKSGMVKLKAPDGSVKEVPEAEAGHYMRMGAQVVQ